MSIIACKTDGCDRPAKSRDWCHKHYEYLRSRGELPPKLCRGCGGPIVGPRWYHSDDCRPRCSVDQCGEIRTNKDWCLFHFTRWKLHGDPSAEFVRMQYGSDQLCAFEGCPTKARKRGFCSSHYNHIRKGDEPRKIIPKSNSWTCAFCGGPSGIIKGFRKTCGPNCHALLRRHGGPLPDTWTCERCEEDFPYVVDGRRRVKFDVLLCTPCQRHGQKHGYSAKQLANRDGIECKICDKPVDMTLVHPDLMRGSVDHIIPLSRGGSNEPDNVQLTHLHCNIKKNNRLDYVAS